MKRIMLLLCLTLCCALNAQAQRNSLTGTPNSRDMLQVVNSLVYDSRTGKTTSGNDFGIEYHYSRLTTGIVGSMYVPHQGNMRLWFTNANTAYYHGDAWQNVCIDSRSPGGNWRRVDGTMDVEITTLSNGRRHIRSWFTPTPGTANARYAVSGLVFEFTLNYGNVAFRFNF